MTTQPHSQPTSSLPLGRNADIRDFAAMQNAAENLEQMMSSAANPPVADALESDEAPDINEEITSQRYAADDSQDQSHSATIEIDPSLVRQTRMQIRNIVNEIALLAQSDCSVADFFDGFLPRLTSALASIGGAVWRLNESGRLELQYQINMAKTGLTPEMENRVAHDLLLNRIIDSGESALVPPQSGTHEPGEPGNPTDCLLVIEPLRIDRQVVGLIEIFQKSGSGPATQRGYLRFLVQMCAIASDFLRNHRLRLFRSEQKLWEKLEGFIRAIHNDLDPRQTTYTIANEGRRLIDCDRVSVARQQGRRCKLQVVSGLDSIDRRAADIKLLNDLVQAVVLADQPLWYHGEVKDLSPQIEKRLQKYVDKSHAKSISIIPLAETERDEELTDSKRKKRKQKKRKLGALIVEQLADNQIDESFRKRVQVVADHSCDALTNATRYDSIFLKSVWERIGRAKSQTLSALPVWLIGMAMVGVGVFLMCVTPYDFELSSEGRLTPSIRHEVFAKADGVLTELHVPENSEALVAPNDLLARLTNEELNVEIENLQGRYKEIYERIKAIERTLNQDDGTLEATEQFRFRGEQSELEESRNSIVRLLQIKQKQLEQLNVVSPAQGQVVTWQLKEKLLRRPVKLGDNIMTIVDPTGPWELELEFPEKKMGHLLNAQEEFSDALQVTFVVASDPQKKYRGRVTKIDRKADVRGDKGNTVLVRADFNKESFPADLLRDGTRVTARVHCGKEPIGYVLFHDVIETVQQKILFWF
jgi:multidrug efflux pump subunit AcrA (membrane-fusion protein)